MLHGSKAGNKSLGPGWKRISLVASHIQYCFLLKWKKLELFGLYARWSLASAIFTVSIKQVKQSAPFLVITLWQLT